MSPAFEQVITIPILGGIFCLLCVYYCLRNFLRRGLRDIKGPWLAKITPMWRLWLVSQGNAHQEYRRLHEKFGPIVRTAPNVVDISDPSAVPQIYSIGSRFYKSKFYDGFSVLYDGENMHSMFSTQDPDEHKSLKRSVAQKFSMTSIRSLEYLVDPCSELFACSMRDLEGSIVDLGAWVQWYAFDVIGAISFSRTFGFMEQRKDVNSVITGLENGLFYGALVGQISGAHRMLLGNITLNKIVDVFGGWKGNPIPIVTDMVVNAIEEYDSSMSHDTERGDFLAFLRRPSKSNNELMAKRELMNHLMNNLLAGSDTTAISLRAVFYYVLRHKDVYASLQKEIDDANAAGNLSTYVTYAESQELPYLQACIKEAMRMHPGVGFPLERIVPQEGATLCGIHLPGGTIVGVNAAVIHRNKDIFGDDADQFRPERWTMKEDEARIRRMENNLLVFGAGARTCIGKNISLMEMGKFVPQVLREFDIEWASPESEWQIKSYWFAKQSGILVRFKHRQHLSS